MLSRQTVVIVVIGSIYFQTVSARAGEFRDRDQSEGLASLLVLLPIRILREVHVRTAPLPVFVQ